jgi:arginyl-tRNA synthetase
MRMDNVKKDIADFLDIPVEQLSFDIPPSDQEGDLYISVFKQAKEQDRPPAELAAALADYLKSIEGISGASAASGYVNITFNYETLFELARDIPTDLAFRFKNVGHGKSVMVEYFSPNTNKPLHVGHLRNLFIGEALSNLLGASGYKVTRANLYNDRGIHISKAQLTYSKWGEGLTPVSTGKKGDHFVGEYYVLFGSKSEQNLDLEEEAQAILRKWETGSSDGRTAWQKMRDWVITGFNETLSNLGIKTFDVIYWESEFWEKGVEIVNNGIENGVFEKAPDGTIIVELPNLGTKTLLRADGTALYITQDLYLAVRKFQEHGPLEKSIYVVAAEQSDHFKTLFQIFKLFGYEWADNCHHLGYGMVLIKGGKLKSREGITADADHIIDILEDMAYKEIEKRHPDLSQEEKSKRARKVALSAIKWDFLKIGALKNINFDLESSLSLKGDTGPYLLYTYARIRSLLRKVGVMKPSIPNHARLHVAIAERRIAAFLHLFADSVAISLDSYSFSTLCAYLYSLAEKFNTFYQSHRILEMPHDVFSHRIRLAAAVGRVLEAGLQLLGIETLEEL